MEHYKTILSALSGAMPKCMSWVLAGTEEGMNARDIFVFAMEQGGENEQLGENEFYVVSSEGAIGFTTKYEYLTRWIFIPTEGEFREAEMQRLREELEFDHQQEEAEAAAAAEAAQAAAAVAAVKAEAEQPQDFSRQFFDQQTASQAEPAQPQSQPQDFSRQFFDQQTAPQAEPAQPQYQQPQNYSHESALQSQYQQPQYRQAAQQPQQFAQQPAPQPVRPQTPTPVAPQEEPQPAFCPGCGNPISPGAKFCRNCGARLG
ncbi:MAG: zinc ribbon domain-containing protein [Lachnospiraceae bacterium]|nr:zinc ribbon domain-containing protein [Lachnospiraceae bacterium]